MEETNKQNFEWNKLHMKEQEKALSIYIKHKPDKINTWS
jgi:hypothetical protein